LQIAIVLLAEDHVIIGRARIDLFTLWTLVVSRVNGLQSNLAFIALVPLIVLTTSWGKDRRLTNESLGIFHIRGSYFAIITLTVVRLPQPS
jgi:hypothetical protein